MDTRKLASREGYAPHNQAEIHQDGGNGGTVALTYSDEGGATAAELVKRWNAYPELIAKLKDVERLLHDGPTAEEDGELVRMVRDHEDDYLSALTDVGSDLRTFLDSLKA